MTPFEIIPYLFYRDVPAALNWLSAAYGFVEERRDPTPSGMHASMLLDGRRIMIGWMDNWETCKEAPRRHPWYAQMSVPRELKLEDGLIKVVL